MNEDFEGITKFNRQNASFFFSPFGFRIHDGNILIQSPNNSPIDPPNFSQLCGRLLCLENSDEIVNFLNNLESIINDLIALFNEGKAFSTNGENIYDLIFTGEELGMPFYYFKGNYRNAATEIKQDSLVRERIRGIFKNPMPSLLIVTSDFYNSIQYSQNYGFYYYRYKGIDYEIKTALDDFIKSLFKYIVCRHEDNLSITIKGVRVRIAPSLLIRLTFQKIIEQKKQKFVQES